MFLHTFSEKFSTSKLLCMERLKPEDVVRILKENGQEVTIEEANSILKFLRDLANHVVNQILINDEKGDIDS